MQIIGWVIFADLILNGNPKISIDTGDFVQMVVFLGEGLEK